MLILLFTNPIFFIFPCLLPLLKSPPKNSAKITEHFSSSSVLSWDNTS